MSETEEEDRDFLDLLPATAGPAPTFYSDADGDIEKVQLHMVSVDTNESWDLYIEPMGDSKLRARAAR